MRTNRTRFEIDSDIEQVEAQIADLEMELDDLYQELDLYSRGRVR